VQVVQTVLEFSIAPFATSDERLRDQLHEAVGEATAVDSMNPVPSLATGAGVVADRNTTIANTVNPITAAWGPLLDKVKLFSEIVDKVSEV
jgi:hypothetical protein